MSHSDKFLFLFCFYPSNKTYWTTHVVLLNSGIFISCDRTTLVTTSSSFSVSLGYIFSLSKWLRPLLMSISYSFLHPSEILVLDQEPTVGRSVTLEVRILVFFDLNRLLDLLRPSCKKRSLRSCLESG